MQFSEHQLHGRNLFRRMHTDRNAASVVGHTHRTVAMHGHVNAGGVTAEGLVGSVVDRFLHDMRRIGGPRIHAGQALHGLDAAQLGDR